MAKKIIAYGLRPIFPAEPGQIMTAAVMTCFVSQRMLSGMGGGSAALHPDVVDILTDDEEVRQLIRDKMKLKNESNPIG